MTKVFYDNNQAGFSLVSALVALGLVAVAAVGIVSLSRSMNTVTKNSSRQTGFTILQTQIATALQNEANCSKSFKGILSPTKALKEREITIFGPGNKPLIAKDLSFSGNLIKSVTAQGDVPDKGAHYIKITVKTSNERVDPKTKKLIEPMDYLNQKQVDYLVNVLVTKGGKVATCVYSPTGTWSIVNNQNFRPNIAGIRANWRYDIGAKPGFPMPNVHYWWNTWLGAAQNTEAYQKKNVFIFAYSEWVTLKAKGNKLNVQAATILSAKGLGQFLDAYLEVLNEGKLLKNVKVGSIASTSSANVWQTVTSPSYIVDGIQVESQLQVRVRYQTTTNRTGRDENAYVSVDLPDISVIEYLAPEGTE